MKYLLFTSLLSLLLSGVDSQGCKGGLSSYQKNYDGDRDACNLNQVTCDESSCKKMGGEWTDDCPTYDGCDPFATSDDDPSCTGPPEKVDRYGQKLYRRKVLANEKLQDTEERTLCHITLELCEGESMITQGVDIGYGDVYRLGAGEEWFDYTGTDDYKYAGMPSGHYHSRSYNAVGPMNENKVQLLIKQVGPFPEERGCTAGVDCHFGISELACMAPVGSELLLSTVSEHGTTEDQIHNMQKPNFSREPGSGPYTINFVGQGVAISEINIAIVSELLEPFASDGSLSTIKEVNFLWSNSYWSDTEYMTDDTNPTDIAVKMFRDLANYGIRLNLMHAISRETHPEAEWPRVDVDVIGKAFKLTNTTNQDPNIKWFVVGAGYYKTSIYAKIEEWGFDLSGCLASHTSYPKCGTNSLYVREAAGADGFKNRGRSKLFQYYENIGQESSSDDGNSHDGDGDSHDGDSHDGDHPEGLRGSSASIK